MPQIFGTSGIRGLVNRELTVELALKIGQKVRENLVNLVEVSDAIRWAQKVLEEKGFVREEANQIAKKLIGKEIKPVAIRFQTSLYQEINRGYEELNNTLFSILEKTTTDPSSVQEKIEKTLNSLLTEEFGKLDPKTAAEKLKENLARALENLDEETRNSIIATIVLKVQSLQKLAQLSFRWQESPAKPLAFQRTIPQQQQEAMKIKRLFIQSLKESYLRKVDEIKIEDLTRKIIEKLEQRAQILRLLSEEDFAKAFVGLLGHQQAIGQSFHITSDELLTWNQIYEAVAESITFGGAFKGKVDVDYA